MDLFQKLFGQSASLPPTLSSQEETEALPAKETRNVYLADNAPVSEAHIRVNILHSSSSLLFADVKAVQPRDRFEPIIYHLATIVGRTVEGTDVSPDHWVVDFKVESEFERLTQHFSIKRPNEVMDIKWQISYGRLVFKDIESDDDRKRAQFVESIIFTLSEEKIIEKPIFTSIHNTLPALCGSYGYSYDGN